MKRTTKLVFALGMSAVVIAACDPANSPLTGPPTSLALSAMPTNPEGYPPDDWVYLPERLDPTFTKFECTFAFGTNVTRLADTACQEKQWGKSGIYRQQVRKIYNISLGYNVDLFRLCSQVWPEQPTPYGPYGPNGCVAFPNSVLPSQ